MACENRYDDIVMELVKGLCSMNDPFEEDNESKLEATEQLK